MKKRDKNWQDLIKGLQDRPGPYKHLEMSLLTKAKVTNIIAVTKYVHQALTNNFHKKQKAQLERMINKFIWGEKVQRILKMQICNSTKKGGLGLKDLVTEEASYRMKILSRIHGSSHPSREMNTITLRKRSANDPDQGR